jgi:hypothetical protein
MVTTIPDADQKLLEKLNDSKLIEIVFSSLLDSVQFVFSSSLRKISLELEGIAYISFTREHNEDVNYSISEVVLSGIGIRESVFLSSTLSYSKAKYEQAHSIMDTKHNLYHINIDGELDINIIASRYRIKEL